MSNLNDLQIRQWIKAGERFEGRSDGNGLTLRYRAVDAAPMWRFRYRFAGKQRVMDLGSYAVLSLADACKQARELRARVALGYDVADEKRNASGWRSPSWTRRGARSRWRKWPTTISSG